MLFNSLEFCLFFVVVLVLYYICPGRTRKYFVLISSYYFYMQWNAMYIILIVLTTIVTYIAAIQIETRKNKRVVLFVTITVLLATLLFFKYGEASLNVIEKILRIVRVPLNVPQWNFLLPVGISFYTFQVIGYIVDVYRGDISAEKHIVRYAVFVSFFPQLVAGPIERSKGLLQSIKKMDQIKIDYDNITHGLTLAVYGLFLKMVIGDRLASIVDYVFYYSSEMDGVRLWIGAIAFSIQIYCDFSGYSLIAIGVSRTLGIPLMENFDTPYFSRTIKDFWRRWHISLSMWFRDYLYIPLGGNRKGKVRNAINLMLTFLLSGLWHGASLRYVIWGGLHGIYQVAGKFTLPIRQKICALLKVDCNTFGMHFFQMVTTYFWVLIAWVFFRANYLGQALEYIKTMFSDFKISDVFSTMIEDVGGTRADVMILVVSGFILLGVGIIKYKKQLNLDEFLFQQPMVFRWSFIVGLCAMVVIFGVYGSNYETTSFLYFQF